MAESFAAQVSEWVKQTKGGVEAVIKESTQRVFEAMTLPRGHGGNMPVDTGFLRASFMASTTSMPVIRANAKPTGGGAYAFDPGPISLVINNADLGETVYIGVTANYAAYVNYGTHGRSGAMFVELAAQKWPQIVKEVEAELAKQ